MDKKFFLPKKCFVYGLFTLFIVSSMVVCGFNRKYRYEIFLRREFNEKNPFVDFGGVNGFIGFCFLRKKA